MTFEPRPRSDGAARARNDRENLLDELHRIDERLRRRVIGTDRVAFHDGSDAYDAASMAIVRLHGVLERREHAFLLEAVREVELRAIGTIRNIVSHGGYRSMDDESFWETVTGQLPELLQRLLERAASWPAPR